MMPWVSASVVLLTMLVETTSSLARDEKTVVVSDNLSARWDTTGWRLGTHDSQFHIEPRKKHGFQKGKASIFVFFYASAVEFMSMGWKDIGYFLHLEIFMNSYYNKISRMDQNWKDALAIVTVNRWTTSKLNALLTWQTNQSGRYLCTAQGFCALLAWLVFEDVRRIPAIKTWWSHLWPAQPRFGMVMQVAPQPEGQPQP